MIRLFYYCCPTLFLNHSAQAEQAFVIDGDTIIVGGVTHRLHGIDAPEEGQLCKTGKGNNWPCGKAATDEMVRLLVTGVIYFISRDNDGFGREISICTLNSIELNRHLVRRGLSWAFRKYSVDYMRKEEQAKSENIGIWRSDSLAA